MVILNILHRQVSLRLEESMKTFLSPTIAARIAVVVVDISVKFVSSIFWEKLDWVFLDSFKGLNVILKLHEGTTDYIY